MNSKEFIKAVDAIVKEKGIDREVVFEAMELALASAYKKNFDSVVTERSQCCYTVMSIYQIYNILLEAQLHKFDRIHSQELS